MRCTVSLIVAFISIFLFCNASQVFGRQFFVAVNGHPNNPGTYSQPWALDTALRMPASRLTGGDTVWIRGGRYVGTFILEANGSTTKPLVYEAYPGERVVLDSYTGMNNNVITLEVNGNYVWLVNIEVENTSPTRISYASSINTATDLHQSTGMQIYGNSIKLINCRVHDVPGTGLGYWSTALNAEVYGCFLYNNGLSALDRGHGPAIYAQNADELQPKAVRNSFLFNGFSTGIQFYASATSNKLKGIIVDSCTIFNMGSLTRPEQGRRRSIVAGAETSGRTNATPGVTRVSGLYIHDNVLYRDTADNSPPRNWKYPDIRENTELGYQDESLSDSFVSFLRNHVYGDPLPVLMHQWDSGVFKYNFLYSYKPNDDGVRNVIKLAPGANPFSNWDSNTYRTNEPAYNTPFSGLSFNKWKDSFNIDFNSTYLNAPPTEQFAFVRRNKYRTNTYYITVMNYAQLDSVLLSYNFDEHQGMSFSLYDVQGSLDLPIRKGIYTGGQFMLPMKLTAVAPTLGITPMPPKHSSAALGTFVLSFFPKITTIKAGAWNDPSTWNVGRVPTHEDDVELQHAVSISGLAWCRTLQTNQQSVTTQSGAHLLISNTGQ